MKCWIAVFVTASIAILALGATGSTSAASERTTTQTPFGVYISEFATRGPDPMGSLSEFIEISNRSSAPVKIGGYRIVATFSARTVQVVEIPHGNIVLPGKVVIICRVKFEQCHPRPSQPPTDPPLPDPPPLLDINPLNDIPDRVGVALLTPEGNIVDTVSTTASPFSRNAPATPLTVQEGLTGLSLHRITFTGNNVRDFIKALRTPGVAVT